MATQIQRRRGTTAQHSTFTGALGELTVDTDKKTVVVHDGITAGGSPLAVASTYAPLANPALTGVPTAPTAAVGTDTTQIATTAFAKAEAASAAPVGSVQYFALSSAPAGWLKANGSLVSRTTYANLFAAIGTVFGAGDGSTTFALPDLRGEFIRGVDDGRGIDTGRTLGSAQADELKSHEHYVHPTGNAGSDTRSFDVDYQTGDGLFFPRPTTSTGGAETRPRNVALLACIRY